LARWDLLNDFLDAYEITVADVRAIISLKFRIYHGSNPNLNLIGTAAAAQRLRSFLRSVKPPIPTDPGFTAIAAGVPNFHDGEVVLVSALCAGGGQYVYTGDKNAIRAMIAFRATEYDAKFRNRVICLEQAILKIIDKFGFGHVRLKISSDLDADAGMASYCFSLGAQAQEMDVRACLEKRIAELQIDCGNLLKI
jgi:hypothetical protein